MMCNIEGLVIYAAVVFLVVGYFEIVGAYSHLVGIGGE